MGTIFNPNQFATSTTDTETTILRLNKNLNTLTDDVAINYVNKSKAATLNGALTVAKDLTLTSAAGLDLPSAASPAIDYMSVADSSVAIFTVGSSNATLQALIRDAALREIWVQPGVYQLDGIAYDRTLPLKVRKHPDMSGEVVFRGPNTTTFIVYTTENDSSIWQSITFESGFTGSPGNDSLISYRGSNGVFDTCKFFSQEFAVSFGNASTNFQVLNCEFYYTKASSMGLTLPSNSTHRYIALYSVRGTCRISGNRFYGFDGHNAHCLYVSGAEQFYDAAHLIIEGNVTDEKVYRFATWEFFASTQKMKLDIRDNIFNVKNSCIIWVGPDHRFFGDVIIKGNTMNMIGGGSKGLIGYYLVKADFDFVNVAAPYATPLKAYVSGNTLRFDSFHASFVPIGDGVFARGDGWEDTVPDIAFGTLRNLGFVQDKFDGLTTSIAAEATARANADSNLTNTINAEATARANADTTLTNSINTKQDIIAVAAERVLVSSSTGAVAASSVTTNELTDTVRELSVSNDNTVNIGTDAISTFNIATGASTQVVNIGTNSGVTTINLGGPGDTVNINGSLTTINTTNKEITDKLITLNKDGGAFTGHTTGFEIEEGGVATGHFKTDATGSQFELKAPANAFTLSTGVLTQNETVAYRSQIGSLQTQITANADHIIASDIQINANVNNITTNTNNIQANSSTIQANSNAIQANTNNIATNTSNIATNTASIQSINTKLEPITNNNGDVGIGFAGISNVGINTTTPNKALTINANSFEVAADQVLIGNSDSHMLMGMNNIAHYGSIQPIQQGVGFKNFSLCPQGGNVGIAKTNPSFTLDVAGNINATNYYIDGEVLKLPYKKTYLAMDLSTSITSLPVPSLGESRNYKIVISGQLPPAANGAADAILCMRVNNVGINYQGFMDINVASRETFFSDRFPLIRTVFAQSNFIHCVVNVTHNFNFGHPNLTQRVLTTSDGTASINDNTFAFKFNSFGSMGNNNFNNQHINSFEFFLTGRDFNVPCNLNIEITSV